MRWPENVKVAGFDLVETVKIVRHVAVRRRDNGRRPAHDVIAAQASILFLQRKAEMIGRVAWRFDGFESPAGAFEQIAISGAFVG